MEWIGWRRRDGGTWQKVEGAIGKTKADAYTRLMELSELVGGESQWEYRILPPNERPSIAPASMRQK